MSLVARLTVPAAREWAPPERARVGAVGVRRIEAPLDLPRVAQLATALGCPADSEAITRVLLQRTALGEGAYEAVWSSVDHLLSHDGAWRAMVSGVVPPSLRAKAVGVATRTDPTDPADSIPALVLAAVGQAVSDPRLSHAPDRVAHGPLSERLFARLRARFASRIPRTA